MIRYKLYDNIGEPGGFGEVVRAKRIVDDIEHQQEFALKILKVNNIEAKDRFRREVRILKSINHPRVIQVIDFDLSNDRPFYVMPIYKTSLRGCLNEIVADYIKIKDIFNSILDGIEYLHSQGIYHRDIKPENFLLNSYTDLVVSDLGLGVNINSEYTRMTKTGIAMGTINYMSPEQRLDSKSIDWRTDIYSLGTVLYECVTGRNPIIIDLNIVPSGMKHVISKCLEPYANDRFQSIEELKQVFNSSIDILIFGVQKNDINDIITQLVVDETNTSNIKNFYDYLYQMDFKREQDIAHDIVMKLSIEIIKNLELQYEKIYVDLISTFVENITSNGWGFEYTDKIASKCKSIFNITNNLKVKSELIYCLIEVGYSHNRWYVNGCVKDMIYSIDDIDLAYIVKENMKRFDKYVVNRLDLNENKLHSIIKEYVYQKEEVFV